MRDNPRGRVVSQRGLGNPNFKIIVKILNECCVKKENNYTHNSVKFISTLIFYNTYNILIKVSHSMG